MWRRYNNTWILPLSSEIIFLIGAYRICRKANIRCFDDFLCPTNALRVVSVSTCQQMSIIFALEHKVLFAKATVEGKLHFEPQTSARAFWEGGASWFWRLRQWQSDPLPLETSGWVSVALSLHLHYRLHGHICRRPRALQFVTTSRTSMESFHLQVPVVALLRLRT